MVMATYPLARSCGGFLEVIIGVWLAETLDGLEKSNRSRRHALIGRAKRLGCHTHGVKGLEGRRGTTDLQVGHVGGIGEHPEAEEGCAMKRSRGLGRLLNES